MNSARSWHRLLGAAGALVFILLAISGLLINHHQALDLDGRFVSASWLLDHYGIDIAPPTQGFAVTGGFVAAANAQLLINNLIVHCDRDELIAAVSAGSFTVIAEPRGVCAYTSSGEFIERIETDADIAALASVGRRIFLRTDRGYRAADADTLDFRAITINERSLIVWATPVALPANVGKSMADHLQSRILTLERLLLDLHSGRFFGAAGVILFDLASIALTALALTGIVLWTRGRNGRNRQRRPCS